ncbi:MAG: right-handed parallel beta-helix repeat-containing protein [Myxococcaceae bacterium]
MLTKISLGLVALAAVLLSGCDGLLVGGDGTPSPDGGFIANPDAGANPPDGGSPPDGGADGGTDGGTTSSQLPAPFDTNATYSSTVYISPSGNNTTGNGSQGSPYQSLSRALSGAGPGLRVVMLPGTYPPQGSLSNLTGSLASPIKIEGQGSVIVDITGGTSAIHLQNPRYVVLENLDIRNSAVHGLNIDDAGSYDTPAEYVVLRNIRFSAIGSGGNNDCLKMSGVDRFYVTQSEFTGCNQGEAIDMVGCHDGIVSGNFFHDMPGTAVQAKGGSADVMFHGNRFANIGVHSINLGGSTDPNLVRPITAPYEGERISAIGNVIEDAVLAPVAFLGCSDCVVAHNTIIRPLRWVARILLGSRDTYTVPSRQGWFINNIVYFRVADISAYVNVGASTQPETFTFGWNLWYATDNSGFSGPTWSGPPAEQSGVIQQSPQFTNATGSDYRVPSTSPAVGAARDMPTGFTAYDFDGALFDAPRTSGALQP